MPCPEQSTARNASLSTKRELLKKGKNPVKHPLVKRPAPIKSQNHDNMKIIYSGIAMVDGRGKINGSVASKNKGGAYVRTKVTPTNPQTTSQQNARNRLATASQAWRDLTESERQSWIDAAPNFPYTDVFGQSKQLSGFQLYVKLNSNLALIGEAAIDVAPAPVAIPQLELATLVADDSANTVIITGTTPVPADFAMVVMATPNVTAGKSFVKNLFRFVAALAAAATSPFAITVPYVALFGDPVEGNKIFVKCFYISTITGQAGIPVQAQTIVVA